MPCLRNAVVVIVVLAGTLRPDVARADSPVWIGFQVVAGLASIAGLGYAVVGGDSTTTTTTTTTTTDDDGTSTTTTTTTTTDSQSQRSVSTDGATTQDHASADHEVVWDDGFLVHDRPLHAAPSLARDETFIGGYRRIDQRLDIMMAPASVRAVKVLTERAIDVEVMRSKAAPADKDLSFAMFVAIEALKLSTLDIAETMGAAELQLIIKEQGVDKPLLRTAFLVEQGKTPKITGHDVKAERVKMADDLLILRDVRAQTKVPLPAGVNSKSMTIILRTSGYGERSRS